MLPKEAEALEKKARSAAINVTASLKQLRQGLNAFKAQMRGFNRLVRSASTVRPQGFQNRAQGWHTWWKPSKFCSIKSAQVETGRASICLISKACWMMCD